MAGQLIAAEPNSKQEPEAIADARRFGADEGQLAELRLHLVGPAFAPVRVWRSNIEAVLAFVMAGTQWRTTLDLVGQSLRLRWIGLDYAGAKIGIEGSGLTLTPRLWTGLRIMEAAARDALNGDDPIS